MENIELKLVKVSDRLYYLPHYEKNDWCTIGLVIGEKHTLMLDSGASGRHVEMFLKQLEEIKEYVVTEPNDIRLWVQKIVPTYSIQENHN